MLKLRGKREKEQSFVVVTLCLITVHFAVIAERCIKEIEHSALGRIADKFAVVAQIRTRVKADIVNEPIICKVGRIFVHLVIVKIANGHFVFGKSTCFVRANYADTADCFGGNHLFYESILL